MNENRSGFIILFQLVFITGFVLLAGAFLQTATFLHNLAHEREKQEYRYWAAYGLAQYGKAVLNKIKEAPQEPIILNPWPVQGSGYSGKIDMTQTGDRCMVQAQLCKEGSVVQEIANEYPSILRGERNIEVLCALNTE